MIIIKLEGNIIIHTKILDQDKIFTYISLDFHINGSEKHTKHQLYLIKVANIHQNLYIPRAIFTNSPLTKKEVIVNTKGSYHLI